MRAKHELTPRERQVLDCVAVECLSNKEAARKLGCGWRTVEAHRNQIMWKLGARNAAQLARKVALTEVLS